MTLFCTSFLKAKHLCVDDPPVKGLVSWVIATVRREGAVLTLAFVNHRDRAAQEGPVLLRGLSGHSGMHLERGGHTHSATVTEAPASMC